MDAGSGPSDLELNQEKLLIAKDEYRRLCYEMKKKELTRNSTHAKMQQQIRQQWELISELKKQKSELVQQLRLQESDSFANKANQNLEDFKKSLNELVKLEEQVKKQTKELEKLKIDIIELDRKLRQKQKDVVKSQRCRGLVLKHQRNIKFLENRLSGSLMKYNQLLVGNKALRDEISSLLLTQSSFSTKYNSIKQLLSSGKKTLADIVQSAAASYQTGESLKYKLNLIKERTETDQKKLSENIKELQILVEQNKQLKEFLDFKMKDRSGSSESEETSRNEQIMEQKLQAYHCIIGRIHMASNCKDVNRICKAYVQQEESNLKLFEKVNELSLEIEKLHEEVRLQRRELEETSQQYKEQNRKDLAVKTDIEDVTDRLRSEALSLENKADERASELESVKEVLDRIYVLLDKISSHKIAFTVDEGITDDNVMQYLEALELRVIDLIKCKMIYEMKQISPIPDE